LPLNGRYAQSSREAASATSISVALLECRLEQNESNGKHGGENCEACEQA
jgi:hypothetical protein